MSIARVIVRLPTRKGHLKCALLLYWWGSGGSEIQSVPGVTTICLTQCNRSTLWSGCWLCLWNVDPFLFNCCANLLALLRNQNTLSYTPMCIMQGLGGFMLPGIMHRSLNRQNRKEHLSKVPDAINCEHLAAQACCNPDKVDEYAVLQFFTVFFFYRVPDPPSWGPWEEYLGL